MRISETIITRAFICRFPVTAEHPICPTKRIQFRYVMWEEEGDNRNALTFLRLILANTIILRWRYADRPSFLSTII